MIGARAVAGGRLCDDDEGRPGCSGTKRWLCMVLAGGYNRETDATLASGSLLISLSMPTNKPMTASSSPVSIVSSEYLERKRAVPLHLAMPLTSMHRSAVTPLRTRRFRAFSNLLRRVVLGPRPPGLECSEIGTWSGSLQHLARGTGRQCG